MKLYQLILTVSLTTTVLCGSVVGEYQDDKLFGNGRFLKRLRNDVLKMPESKSKDAKASSKKSKSDANAKQPTPGGNRSSGKVPTPAVRSNRAPSPAVQPFSAARPTAAPASGRVPTKFDATELQSKTKRSGKPPNIGFGMQLEMKSEICTVSKVDSRGNAHEAGLKKGDVILQAGGVEIGSTEAFDEIANILGEGDQLEFKIERRGKKKDLMIQFGTAPEEGEVTETSRAKTENDYSVGPRRDDKPVSGLRSVLGQTQPNPIKSNAGRDPGTLQQTIEEQRRQIEQMQREIKNLKRQSQFTPTKRAPINNTLNAKNTFSDGLNLSGPGK